MPTVKKLPKWAIRQAGGINKKAWALARRGKGTRGLRKSMPKARKKAIGAARKRQARAATPRNSKPGIGAWFKIGRTADVFSGPAQGAVANFGVTPEAGFETLRGYSAGLSEGAFNPDIAKPVYGGIGTGLLRNWLRSKMGIYRGLGQKKILSGVMAANPEILATTEVNPVEDIRSWNGVRTEYDRSADVNTRTWDINPNSAEGSRFWRSIGLDAGLKVGQKATEKWLTPLLPPGINL